MAQQNQELKTQKSIKTLNVCITAENNLTYLNGGSEGLFDLRGEAEKADENRRDRLSFEEIEAVAEALSEYGLSKIRLLGGEPLLRDNLTALLRKLSKIESVRELVILTNASLFGDRAAELKTAGLTGIEVSMDTLDPARYEVLTGVPDLEAVSHGLSMAEAAGLTPLRFYVQPAAGFNDDEILSFAQLTLSENMEIIFIGRKGTMIAEGGRACPFLSNEEVRERFSGAAEETGEDSEIRFFRFSGAPGLLGLLDTESDRYREHAHAAFLSLDGMLSTIGGTHTVDLGTAAKGGREEVLKMLEDKKYTW